MLLFYWLYMGLYRETYSYPCIMFAILENRGQRDWLGGWLCCCMQRVMRSFLFAILMGYVERVVGQLLPNQVLAGEAIRWK